MSEQEPGWESYIHSFRSAEERVRPAPDPDVLIAGAQLQRDPSKLPMHRQYIRDRFLEGLTSPLVGVRDTYAKDVAEIVPDRADRMWLAEEVLRRSTEKEFTRATEYDKLGYLERFASRASTVGASFANESFRMVESIRGVRKTLFEDLPDADDLRFRRSLEEAKQSGMPDIPRDLDLAGQIAVGGIGIAPKGAVGALATIAGGTPGAIAAWTAMHKAKSVEDFIDLGLSKPEALVVGTGVAGALGAIEATFIPDPTGLIKKGPASLLKKTVKKRVTQVIRGAIKQPVGRRVAQAAVGAAGRYAGEVIEEGASGGVQKGAEFLARKAKIGIPDISASDIPDEALRQMLDAAPALLLPTVSGAGGHVGVTISRINNLTKGANETAIRTEIIESAFKRRTPSRTQWEKWGLPEDLGKTRKERRKLIEEYAGGYQAHEVARSLATGITPTAQQWDALGLPKKAKATEESRREWVQSQRKALVERAIAGLRAKIAEAQAKVEAEAETEAPVKVEAEAPQPPGKVAEPITTEPITQAAVKPAQAEQQLGVSEEGVPTRLAAKLPSEEPTVPVSRVPPGGGVVASETAEAGRTTAAKMAPSRHDFPVEKKGTGKRASAREIVRKIERIWGAPIRSGRILMRKARGIYKLKEHITRLAKGEEASPAVAIHESIGHHLDNTTDVLSSAPKAARKELGRLDYDQKQKRSGEGFAEFVRAYITGATELQKGGIDLTDPDVGAPAFLAHFEKWLDANPEFRAKLEETKAPVKELIAAGAVGRVKGALSETGKDETGPIPLRERLKVLKDYVWTRIKEQRLPVRRMEEEAIRRGYKPGGENTPAELYSAMMQVGPHFTAMAIEEGMFRLGGKMEKIGPSFKEALNEIGAKEGDYENFVTWAYARSAVESWRKGKNPGGVLKDFEVTVAELYDPRYVRAADKLTEIANASIQILVETGVIDAKEGESVTKYYKHYLPFMRARKGVLGTASGRKLVDLSTTIHGRSGSGLQVLDPIESLVSLVNQRYERAARQLVTTKLHEVAKETKGMGRWVEEIKPGVIATEFKFDQVRGQIAEAMSEDLGLPKDEVNELLNKLDPMTALTVWKPDILRINGEPVARITVDSKPVYLYLDPELAYSLGGMESIRNLDMVTRMARGFTAALKVGATRLNPDFIFSNALRDFQTYLLQGEKGLTGAFDPAKYAAAYVTTQLALAVGRKGDPVVSLFRKMGGELSTYAGMDRARLRAGVKRAVAGKQGKFATFTNITGFSEVAPRISEFSAILEKEGWLERVEQGESPPMEVLVRAINAAHDVTVDFRRMGAWGRYLNYYLPFFNARFEGVDKFRRTLKDNPSKAIMRAGMQITLPAMLYWWYRHNDDDYKERPEWQDGYYIFTDGDGNPIWRIPKSHEWGLIGSGVERMLDAMYDKDPEPVERWFKQVLRTTNPGSFPAGVTPAFGALANWDTFRERPIVSEHLQKFEGRDQYYEYTSRVAKGIAHVLHEASGGAVSLSPAKIDYLANNLSGGLLGKITSPLDKMITGGNWSVSDVPGLKGITLRKDYAKSVEDFYAEKETLSKAYESGKLHGKKLTAEDNARRKRMQNVAALMTEMRAAMRTLPASERTNAELALIGLARAALDKAPLERYKSPLKTGGTGLKVPVTKAVQKHIAQKASTASGSKKTERTTAAINYLVEMDVPIARAADLATRRLRSQGVSSSATRGRIKQLKGNF